MLEGNEFEKEYDAGAGKLVVDVTGQGAVKFSNTYNKDLEFAKIKSVNEVESNIFMLARMIAKKTDTTWDDKAVEGIISLLGLDAEDEQVKAQSMASLQ